jgi:integrase
VTFEPSSSACIQARRLDCNLIFHRGGKRVGEFRKLWKTACKKAGLQGKHVYDLRRTAVRNLVRAGVEETVAMKISGHRTRAVFDRYNITSDEDIRRAVVKTAQYVSNLPSKTVVTPIAATRAKA